MSNIKTAAAAAILAIGLLPGSTIAAESALQLIVGGEAYDGPPKFEVSFDGKVIGEASVEAAIDTASVGRFAEAGDKAEYVQSFDFAIPEDVFTPRGEVRIRFVNEAYGGDGSNRDRNLYLASVAVNGRAVTLSGLSTQGTTAAVKNETLGEFLVLRDGNAEGVSRPPEGGWPQPVTEAKSSPAKAPPAPDVAPATELAALKDVPEAAPQPAQSVRPDEQERPVRVAALDPEPTAPAAVCAGEALYNVVGFNENSNDLTPRLTERLDQIVADIGDKRCRVQITGYSSRQGDFATNALFAIERAQNVLAYLKAHGLDFERVAATGGGATDRFGKSLAANRRVVITVGP
jgi:outer membrane protein OmpA-like peptidoglycan-associated protein